MHCQRPVLLNHFVLSSLLFIEWFECLIGRDNVSRVTVWAWRQGRRYIQKSGIATGIFAKKRTSTMTLTSARDGIASLC